MDVIKRVFGFGMLAIALWLITRILPLSAGLALWAVYAAFAAFYLLPPQEAPASKATSARRFAALLTAIFAVALANQALSHWLAPQHASSPGAAASQTSFREINNEQAFAQALAASDKPVILDFYADWCISCKVWERDIWHNPAFAADLADFTLLKVDVTDFNAEHQAMFRRLNVVAPPTVLVFPAHGTLDAPLATIVGEMKADDFRTALQKWR